MYTSACVHAQSGSILWSCIHIWSNFQFSVKRVFLPSLCYHIHPYSAGLLSDPSESSDMANSVQDSDGLCFIPAFSGIQVNYSASTVCDRNEVD